MADTTKRVIVISQDKDWEQQFCKDLKTKRPQLIVESFFDHMAPNTGRVAEGQAMELFCETVDQFSHIVVVFGNITGCICKQYYPSHVTPGAFIQRSQMKCNKPNFIAIALTETSEELATVTFDDDIKAYKVEDVFEEFLKALDGISFTLKIRCKDSSSPKFQEITEQLHNLVDRIQHPKHGFWKIMKDFFEEYNLRLTELSKGCIRIHLSAYDQRSLHVFHDAEFPKRVINMIAITLLLPELQEEFITHWSVFNYNGAIGD